MLNHFKNQEFINSNISLIHDSEGNDIGVEIFLSGEPLVKDGIKLEYDYRYRYWFGYTGKSDCTFKDPSNIKSVVVAQEYTGEFVPVKQFLSSELQFFPGEDFTKRTRMSKIENGRATSLQFDVYIQNTKQSVFLSPLESNNFSIIASDSEGKEFKRFISQDDLVAKFENYAPFSRQYIIFESKFSR